MDYHELPNGTTPQKRLVEHVRTLYFKPNLQEPEPFQTLNHLGITYETYKLALTDDLLNAVLGAKLTADVQADLNDHTRSGYLSGAGLATAFESAAIPGQYWIRSGFAGCEPDAPQHFYLPERYTDPFNEVTTLKFDNHDLFVESSTDPVGNTVAVQEFDFRVLAPREIRDINDNLSEVIFDVLGMPSAMALKGKGNEGDNLNGLNDALIKPDLSKLIQFFTGSYNETAAKGFLGNATARYIYYFGEQQSDGQITYGNHPACAAAVLRERHVAQLGVGEESPIQSAFEYSDGMGTVLVKKIQAEPEPESTELRWVASGKTILNNKGKTVKQYEPYFSPNQHRFEEPTEIGVTPLMYYDAPGRLIRTELPDGSFSKVEFTPWHVLTYDPNDTAFDSDPAKRSDWYRRRKDPTHPRFAEFNGAQNVRAAELVEMHADTPATTFLDSLGREVINVAHNRFKDSQGTVHDDKYVTFTKLDAEGKPLWIRDARKNLVMQYITPPVPSNQVADPQTGFVPCYDIAGNLLFQHSMDAGDRWMLNDAAGKPMYGWDNRGHIIATKYDQLRRPREVFVSGGDDIPAGPQPVLGERIVYGESQGSTNNHRGTIFQHFDGAGVVTNAKYDFKGNLIETSRRLVKEYQKQIDWNHPPADDETFTSTTQFDALNRPILITTPHNANIVPSEIRPIYNEANLLNEARVKVRGGAEEAYVTNIDYNAKGQRELVEYGNGATTAYEYDPDTFRLTHLKTIRQSDNAQLQDLFYTYDPVGNITSIRDDAQQTIYFNNSVVKPHADYTYDAIYRLIQAGGREHLGQVGGAPSPTSPTDAPRVGLDHPNDGHAMGQYEEEYLYDEVGNILSVRHHGTNPNHPGWKRCYQYALGSNRLLSTGSPSDPNNPDSVCLVHYAAAPVYAEHYEYDTHGNMTAMPHLSDMEWNFEDQLQMVDLGGGGKAYYVYDAAGQRTRKVWEKSFGIIEERIYLGGFEVFRRRNGAGTTTLERETLHVMDDKQRIALVETRTQGNDSSPTQLVRYQFSNHLGSASLELNEQAQNISYEEYYPYGGTSYQAVRHDIEVPLKRHRYTGKERDEETGLYYHGARYYAPWLGRWTAADPAGIVDGENLFAYARGNPVRLIDVSGTQVHPGEGGAEGAGPVGNGALTGIASLADRAKEAAQRAVREKLEEEKAIAQLTAERATTPETPTPISYANQQKQHSASEGSTLKKGSKEANQRSELFARSMQIQLAWGEKARTVPLYGALSVRIPYGDLSSEQVVAQNQYAENAGTFAQGAAGVRAGKWYFEQAGRPLPPISETQGGAEISGSNVRELSSVWDVDQGPLGPGARGLMIEGHLGGNLPRNFMTIDKASTPEASGESRVITSIKSLNTNNPSYQAPGAIYDQLAVNKLYPSGRVQLAYIVSLNEFETHTRGGKTITAGPSTQRVLQLAIPTTPLTNEQWSDIFSAEIVARQQNISLQIVRIH
jgi:RHS repeat-associated protein